MADRRTRLERRPDAPSHARRHLEGWLGGVLGANQLEDVKLLVSELVTNAVRHAGSDGGIELEVAMARGRVRVSVTDPGSGFRKPRVGQPPPDSIGGRGLLIVDRIAARWGVDGGRRTRVWFEVDR